MDSETLIEEEDGMQKTYIKVLTVISFTIATLFLITHLVVFLITEYTRTIMGKNFAMFCFSLLLGYVTFIGSMLLQNGDTACVVIAIIGHYVYLTQSSWLLVTSVETWKSLKTSKAQQHYEKLHSWRFLYYSLFGWIAPAIITGLVVYVEFSQTTLPDNLKPSFSPKSCRFDQPAAFLLFYIIPTNVNLVLNFLVLGVIIASLVNVQRNDTTFNRDMVQEFRYYFRLNILVGVIWVTGLMGEYYRNEALLVIFIVMNAALGLYIFLIFTFNNKISTFIYYVDTGSDLRSLIARNDEDGTSEIYLKVQMLQNFDEF